MDPGCKIGSVGINLESLLRSRYCGGTFAEKDKNPIPPLCAPKQQPIVKLDLGLHSKKFSGYDEAQISLWQRLSPPVSKRFWFLSMNYAFFFLFGSSSSTSSSTRAAVVVASSPPLLLSCCSYCVFFSSSAAVTSSSMQAVATGCCCCIFSSSSTWVDASTTLLLQLRLLLLLFFSSSWCGTGEILGFVVGILVELEKNGDLRKDMITDRNPDLGFIA